MNNNDNRYRSFFENSADAMLIIENDEFVDCNSATVEMLGYVSKEEIINKPPFKLSPKFQPDGCLSFDKATEMIRIAKELGNHKFEWDHLRNDGTIIPVEVSLTAIKTKEGLRLHTIWRDISNHKQIETALRLSEEKFRLLLNSTAEAIYGLDTKGNCIFCNPACIKILGYERESDFLGKNMHELIHHHRPDGKAYPEKECKVYLPFLIGEGVHVDDEVFWRADGSHFDVEYSAYPIRKGEEVLGSVVTFHDISERKKAQADLIEAKRLAEDANAAKSDFLANISHEIRTPITVFMGAIEHLLEIDKDPKCQEVLDLAHISSRRLYVLLNEILDHSKIKSRQMDLEEETFKVRRCLNETIEMMNDRAQKKHLELVLDVSPSVPQEMLGDPYRLGQILLNLIGNAIKFTEKGEVIVKVKRHDDYLKFNVSDTGIGISEDKLEYIFESFRQVDSSSTRRHGGVGLGLAISKGLTELMGGRISAHSELGQGSVFSFTLPLKIMKN